MRQTLPKALHTVTAVVNVARYIDERRHVVDTSEVLIKLALNVLGFGGYASDDPVVAKCIATLDKVRKQ